MTPLYARAHAAELLPSAEFRDPLAAQLLDSTGYVEPEVLRDPGNALGSLYRAMCFDDLTRRFAAAHPDGTVVSVGIGLCTRAQRLAGQVPDSVRWVGVDVPEVVELRRKLLPGERVRLHAGSIVEPGWVDGVVPAGRGGGERGSDRKREDEKGAEKAAGKGEYGGSSGGGIGPVLVLAEGVLMYLEPEGLASFLRTCHRELGPGTELVADYMHPRIALSDRHPIVKATGARFRSGARNGARLARVVPGWELTAEHQVMERIGRLHRATSLMFRTVTLGSRPYGIAHLRATRL